MNPRGVPMEVTAGALSFLVAGALQAAGVYEVTGWRIAVAALAGVAGAWVFMAKVGFDLDRQKILAVVIGAVLACVFGPLMANGLAHYFSWLPPGYPLDAASGFAIGLASTPALKMTREPGAAIAFILVRLLPFGASNKKDPGP